MLFVTNNDTVYGLGANGYGCLGFSHDMDVKTPQIIRELCGQRIQQFINGWDFVLAMNEDNHVFSTPALVSPVTRSLHCGLPQINFGQLITQLNDKNIAYICCGVWHSLALTTDGKVYGWGDNTLGQIGCGWGRNSDHQCGHQSPEDIFIPKLIPQNGRFIKLCDFGLAVEHQKWK
ncbi:unnamed protein product [Oppiella nova]|uniref:Uncharacterized protein n=1 Tax=Oppiella nova TaxID=334625 RepID=A0A7R9M9S3_9ACAR|nr:unnamed protein product [Oppiella nova]CAG2172289.1 unnamed protein product [Oppiella nova]